MRRTSRQMEFDRLLEGERLVSRVNDERIIESLPRPCSACDIGGLGVPDWVSDFCEGAGAKELGASRAETAAGCLGDFVTG